MVGNRGCQGSGASEPVTVRDRPVSIGRRTGFSIFAAHWQTPGCEATTAAIHLPCRYASVCGLPFLAAIALALTNQMEVEWRFAMNWNAQERGCFVGGAISRCSCSYRC